MNSFLQSFFGYSKLQRRGLCALFFLIVCVQFAIWLANFQKPWSKSDVNPATALALQQELDSLKNARELVQHKMYPFNPNFISDYKGYRLGMSVKEIDRLHAFRKQDKYVNSAAEFQKLTGVSDSLLKTMSGYFKFPDWVNKKRIRAQGYQSFDKKISITDINAATKEQLIAVYGIGPGLSERILKQRELLGGFVSMDQMQDVWGLSPEVIVKLNERFQIKSAPNLKKIAINEASLKELAAFPYFRYALAKQIVTYRTMSGKISNTDDLAKINGFPIEKMKIISLYLEF